ncbi:hypothetical protein GCM10010402_66180 [Actinomadura luteofluorescens]|uniref:hypothetical protein n=1 Tax=Actinomadura luteofluorescens TaxID=46163 RepID=UPI002164A8B8|nr:hypothetical protein [Actinomadura glauciflava]MCR3744210.1 hypothetical protein [Actinomadura glauciflava]
MSNTLPTAPGAIIGYRRNGRPIYLLAGGSGEGGDGSGTSGSDPSTGGDGGTGTDPGTGQNGDGGQTPPSTDPGTGTDGGGEGDISSLPAWAQKVIRDTRGEAASHRTKAKDAETKHAGALDAIAKALGLKGDDKPTDPAKLAEDLATERAGGQQARTELAVFKAAGKHGADPEKLLDSRKFADQLKDVDPGDTRKIGDLIKKAVEDNPTFKAAAPPATSGAPMGGSPPDKKPKTLAAAVDARYKK